MLGLIALLMGMFLLLINYWFKSPLIYLAIIACMVGCVVEPEFKDAWFQTSCVLVMILCAIRFFLKISKGVGDG